MQKALASSGQALGLVAPIGRMRRRAAEAKRARERAWRRFA